MMRTLCPYNRIELSFEHSARRVEFIKGLATLTFKPDADGLTFTGRRLAVRTTMALPKELAESSRGSGSHFRLEALGRSSDFAFLIGIATVALAVRFEAATLVQVEHGTTDLVRRERSVQRFGTKSIWIQVGKSFTRLEIGGHQSEAHQHLHQSLPALYKAISPPPGPSRAATLLSERLLVFGVAAVVKDANTAIHQRDRHSPLVDLKYSPAN
jgi:hypothetical protein